MNYDWHSGPGRQLGQSLLVLAQVAELAQKSATKALNRKENLVESFRIARTSLSGRPKFRSKVRPFRSYERTNRLRQMRCRGSLGINTRL